ncbi:hypothetical protein [Lysinibacillus fusiformis]
MDMMPVVKDFNLVDTFNLEMRKIGNAAKGENV